MAKRKRDQSQMPLAASPAAASVSLQIITGSYERCLHGLIATLPAQSGENVAFVDSFLFNAHASAIRCLALSPPPSPSADSSCKVILASGGTDERINLYQLSTALPPVHLRGSTPGLAGTPIAQNPKNREMGSLMHHSSNISALHFPSRAKLFSGADDNTVAVTRTRDWLVLSSIKAPIPKAQGRPSGDTAGPGDVPSGINDFAVHPSQKLMISVSKGEKCMRMWNVMTGKKASVLSFDREMLQNVGEGKWSTGEGRRVRWSPDGEQWVVAFERGFVVYGLDSRPTAQTLPRPMTKIHQIHFLPSLRERLGHILAVSVEDGRILLYSTKESVTPDADSEAVLSGKEAAVPSCKLIAQLGGKEVGLAGRIKDFEVLPLCEAADRLCIITGSSNGTVSIWLLDQGELNVDGHVEQAVAVSDTLSVKHVGEFAGTHDTGSRITCLKAFIMTSAQEGDRETAVKEYDHTSSDEIDSE